MPSRENSKTLNGILRWSVKQGEPMTHVAMDGGRFNIPEEHMGKFYENAAEDITNGNFLCLAEMKTGEFPLFLDGDIELPLDVSFDFQAKIQICSIMNKQIAKFFPESEHDKVLKTIILAAEPRIIKDDIMKHGLHIHYPKLIVNTKMAIQIRSSIIAGLELLSPLSIDWNKAIDYAPYGGSGSLRMLGAPKANPCDHCKCNKKLDCIKCRKTRYLEPIPSYYKLYACLTGFECKRDAEHELCYKNTIQLLKATTVRCKEDTSVNSHFTIYPGCPIVDTNDDQLYKSNRTGKPPEIVNPEKVVHNSLFKSYTQVTDPILVEAAERILHGYAKPHYINAKISSLKVNKAGNTYIGGLSGEGRNYCLKQNRDHKSNRVFIRIKHDKRYSSYTVSMGCPDEDCKKWESREVNLNMNDRKLFFRSMFEKRKQESSFYESLTLDFETNKKSRS